MEHRIGTRKKLEFEIILRQNNKELGRFKTIDISLGGIGLRGSVDILTNSLVTVCLLPYHTDKKNLPELRALVVHQNADTIGLMWTEHEFIMPKTMESLCFTEQKSNFLI